MTHSNIYSSFYSTSFVALRLASIPRLRKNLGFSTKTNKFKETPLHLASKEGNLDVIKTLIEEGADINLKNEDGRKPIDLASVDAVRSYLAMTEKTGSKDGLFNFMQSLFQLIS